MKRVIILPYRVFVTWLALVTFVPCVKSDAEVVSDYRSVNYEDLLPSLDQFFDEGVEHFDELLFDSPHAQLIVGKYIDKDIGLQ